MFNPIGIIRYLVSIMELQRIEMAMQTSNTIHLVATKP